MLRYIIAAVGILFLAALIIPPQQVGAQITPKATAEQEYQHQLDACHTEECFLALAQGPKSDMQAFKERVAECKTHGCLVNVSHLYFNLHGSMYALSEVPANYRDRKVMELEVARMRGQLHDPDIQAMFEDGRWNAKTEREKKEWTEKRWGVHPRDYQQQK